MREGTSPKIKKRSRIDRKNRKEITMTTTTLSNLFTNTTKSAIDDLSELLNDVEKDEATYCEIIESNRQRLCDEYGIPSVTCAIIFVTYGENTLIDLLSLTLDLSEAA